MEFKDLYGIWKIKDDFSKSMSDKCKDTKYEVSPDNLKIYSGKQVVNIKCKIAKKHNDFLFLVVEVKVNDEPNYQGVSPEASRAKYETPQIWRQSGRNIHIVAPKKVIVLEKL